MPTTSKHNFLSQKSAVFVSAVSGVSAVRYWLLTNRHFMSQFT
jgi:hypothetical protein